MRIPIVDQMLALVRKQPAAVAATPRPAGGSKPRDERIRETLLKAPVGIATTTGDGHWLFVNDRFRTLIGGYTRDDLSRITMHGITHPDDAKAELVLMKRLAAREIDRYRMEKRLMAKNGRYRSVDVTVAIADDLLISIVDEPVPSVLDSIHAVAVIISDERGVITGWNAGAQAILGYRKSQIVGKNRRQLYRDTDVWAGRSTGTLVSAAMERMEMNDWRVRADGQHIWVHCAVAPFESGGVRGFVETINAVTEDTTPIRTELEKRKRTEESLREAFDDLRRSSEETMTELRIMTGALRDEIDRRKAAEEELRRVSEELAAVPQAIEVEEEEVSVAAPPQRTWMSLEGTSFEEVLRACGTQQRTGTLLVARDGREKEIFFENGRLFSCASNDPEKFLAERLVATGAISEDQRQKAVEIKRASQLALGRILLILGAIDEAQLVAVMREKLALEIDELLTWSEGRYVFVDGEVPSLQLVPLRIDVEALLAPAVVFIASSKSGKVHQPTCLSARRISGAARLEVKTTAGFDRCRQCFR
jgi:PAS domain S-box-containing protein